MVKSFGYFSPDSSLGRCIYNCSIVMSVDAIPEHWISLFDIICYDRISTIYSYDSSVYNFSL
jgi:hypothetical protein